MIFNIRTKDITLSSEQHEYVQKKLLSLEKYCKATEGDNCVMDGSIEKNTGKDGNTIFMEIRISLGKKTFMASEKCSTIEEGIDLIHDKLKTQLQRYKEKMTDHHAA
jgi:ribosomal subunit interface protein